VQREKSNALNFDNVYTFLDIDMPDAQRIKALEGLSTRRERRPNPELMCAQLALLRISSAAGSPAAGARCCTLRCWLEASSTP
jgi:hypothetical protein